MQTSKKLNMLKANTHPGALYWYPVLRRNAGERIAYLPIISQGDGVDWYWVEIQTDRGVSTGLWRYEQVRELAGDMRQWSIVWRHRDVDGDFNE